MVDWGPAKVVSFDTNAFSRLIDRSDPLARAALVRLRRMVKHRRVRVSVTLPLLWELSRKFATDPGFWHRAVRELMALGAGRILNGRPDRTRNEIGRWRPLRRRERLHPEWASRDLLRRVLRGESVDAEAKHVAWVKEQLGNADADAREKVRAFGDDAAKRAWIAQYRKDASVLVADWYNDGIERERGKRAASVDEVRALPSVWAWSSFHLALIYVVGMEADGMSRVDGNDRMDQEHYADAAYSDVLVTNDRRFKRVAGLCAPPRVKLLGFGEWATGILSPNDLAF